MNVWPGIKLTFVSSIILSSTILHTTYAEDSSVPIWIKDNAAWWGDNLITDDEFINALEYLINKGIIVIPSTSASCLSSDSVPDWIKNTATWWGDNLISEEDFLNAVQYLVSHGIINISWEMSVVERNGRLLGIDANETISVDYDTALTEIKDGGAGFVALALQWDTIETSPGVYDSTMLKLINWFYPTHNIPIILGINPIDTNNLRVPTDLRDVPFDDPNMINRFNNMIDFVFENTQDVKILALNIGNEVDGTLNPNGWSEYETFYQQITRHIKNTDRGSDIQIGTKVSLSGLMDHPNHVNTLNKISDVIMLTYYPLNKDFSFKDPSVIKDAFQNAVANSDGKPVYFLELGYSSGELISSSEEKQSKFISEVFKSWDLCREEIPLINFTWLHDKNEEVIEGYLSYYALPDERFAEYLQTLGLKHNNGTAKQAWNTLIEETRLRGW